MSIYSQPISKALSNGREVLRAADKMQKNKLAAAKIRIRYLLESIEDYGETDVEHYWELEALDEIIYLLRNAVFEIKAPIQSRMQVTEEMIEQARMYPITNLVEFNNGKCIAWCHDDKKPSMFHGWRKNLAICPVCDKKFGPIDVLIKRDGYKFYDAVRELCK